MYRYMQFSSTASFHPSQNVVFDAQHLKVGPITQHLPSIMAIDGQRMDLYTAPSRIVNTSRRAAAEGTLRVSGVNRA